MNTEEKINRINEINQEKQACARHKALMTNIIAGYVKDTPDKRQPTIGVRKMANRDSWMKLEDKYLPMSRDEFYTAYVQNIDMEVEALNQEVERLMQSK